ncbi:hypothetical protein KC19_3G097200, partial [Ceratodon purpureus]
QKCLEGDAPLSDVSKFLPKISAFTTSLSSILSYTHTHTRARASWTWVSIGVELSSEQIGAWGVFLPHTRYLFLVNFSVCRGIPLHVGVLVILTAWEWNCHEGRDLNVERERQARMHGDQSIICVEFG